MTSVSRETPDAARTVFGSRLPIAERYADILATAGVDRGLIGPREAPRLWDRHLLNCAVVEAALSPGDVVYDVGSGAGLPGLVFGLLRPDVQVHLVEPLQRRADFLREVVAALGLVNLEVLRDRAEQLPRPVGADVVTARAVAPLERLARWSLPLLRPGGSLLALKGSRAAAEVSEATPVLRRLGAARWTIEQFGAGVLAEPTTVVRVVAGEAGSPPASARRTSRGTDSRATRRVGRQRRKGASG